MSVFKHQTSQFFTHIVNPGAAFLHVFPFEWFVLWVQVREFSSCLLQKCSQKCSQKCAKIVDAYRVSNNQILVVDFSVCWCASECISLLKGKQTWCDQNKKWETWCDQNKKWPYSCLNKCMSVASVVWSFKDPVPLSDSVVGWGTNPYTIHAFSESTPLFPIATDQITQLNPIVDQCLKRF